MREADAEVSSVEELARSELVRGEILREVSETCLNGLAALVAVLRKDIAIMRKDLLSSRGKILTLEEENVALRRKMRTMRPTLTL